MFLVRNKSLRLASLAIVCCIPNLALAQVNTGATAPTTAVGGAIHTVGNASTVVHDTHEAIAPVVVGTAPAAYPFAYSVNAASNSLSKGVQGTGSNVAKNGLQLNPTSVTKTAPVAAPKVVQTAKGTPGKLN